jgi:hypothetical protein
LLLLSINVNAAEKIPQKKHGIRINYDILGYNINALELDSFARARNFYQNTFINFGFSFQLLDKKNHRNYHDFALSRWWFQTSTLGRSDNFTEPYGKKSSLQVGVRYGYNLRLGKKDKNTQFYLEFPVEVFYFHSNFTSIYSTYFPQTNRGVGINTGVTPRFQWHFAKQFYLDITLPISVFNGRLNFKKIDNPNVPLNERSEVGFGSYFSVPFVTGRIGLGIRF